MLKNILNSLARLPLIRRREYRWAWLPLTRADIADGWVVVPGGDPSPSWMVRDGAVVTRTVARWEIK